MPSAEKKAYLGLALHHHQPVDNFPWVFEQVYHQAYLPLVDALERHPAIRLSLHYSGPLLDWMLENQPVMVERIGLLASRGQVELIGGGYYEPILPAVPESDRLGQIAKLSKVIRQLFGQEPTGLWLTERVWEPHLPKALAQAGIKWTVVDDTHFKLAGLKDEDLFGYYITEEEGLPLKVFASSKRLRYLIPWQDVDEVISYLREQAGEGNRIAVMGDDGEKFGSWPQTYAHCWEKGWMERFLLALEQNSEWLKTVPLGEYAERFPPSGRIYLPTASYAEMMEWALPFPARLEFARLVKEMENARREDVLRYMRGGFWRNFLVKYPEANAMHKKMLRIHHKVHDLPPSEEKEQALNELWKGQSNCGYWHGVFGGVYLGHIRRGIYRHLVRAEALADRPRHPRGGWLAWEQTDFDNDGQDELLVESEAQDLYFDLAEGGCLFEWDLKRPGHNLGATMTRQPEPYHQTLVDMGKEMQSQPPGQQGVATIHHIVRAKQGRLWEHLHYDSRRRASLVDHFVDSGVTLDHFMATTYEEKGDFASQSYEARVKKKGREGTIYLHRDGYLELLQKRLSFRVDKEVRLLAQEEGLSVSYTLNNPGDSPIACVFGSEWNLAFTRADGEHAGWRQQGNAERVPLPASGEIKDMVEVSWQDPELGLALSALVDSPATLWRFPIETVSSSEDGFELTFQGSCLLFCWPLNLLPGETWQRELRWRVTPLAPNMTGEDKDS